jgi:hypothetical protein
MPGCLPYDLTYLISLRSRHNDFCAAEVQSDPTFVTMTLQRCVSGLGAFWRWLAAMQSRPFFCNGRQLESGFFYAAKGARVDLTTIFFKILNFEVERG